MSDDALTAGVFLGVEGGRRNPGEKAEGAAVAPRAELPGDLALGDPVNWAAMSHRELFAAVHQNNEPTKGHELSREWGDVAGELEEVTSDFADSVRRSESGWQGEAAEAARTHLLELARRGAELAETVRGVGERVSEESTVVERAKAAMPEPLNFDFDGFLRQAFTEGGLAAFTVASSAIAPMANESNSRHQQAVDVMTRMESESRQVDASTPAFAEEQTTARSVQAASGGSGGAAQEAAAFADSRAREGLTESAQAASFDAPTKQISIKEAQSAQASAAQAQAEGLQPGASVAGVGAGTAESASPSTQTQKLPVLDTSAAGNTPSQPFTTESASASAPPVSPQVPSMGGQETPNASRAMAFGGTAHSFQDAQARTAAFSQSASGERSTGWQGTLPRGAAKRFGETERGGKNVSRPPTEEETRERMAEFELPERGSSLAERDAAGLRSEAEPPVIPPVPQLSAESGAGMPPGGMPGGLGAGAAGGGAGGAGALGAVGGGAGAVSGNPTPLQPGGSSSAAPLPNQSGAAIPPPASTGAAGAGNAAGGAYGGMPMGAGRQGGNEAERQSSKYLKDQEIVEVPQPSSPKVLGEKFKKKQ